MTIRTVTFAALVAVLGLVATPAQAWWCTGHMMISEIARKNLHSGVEEKVNKYVRYMNEHGPFKQSPNMVEAACWADDLKSQGLRAMAQWHFINQPYDPSQFPLPKSSELQKDNVATEITDMQKAGRDYRAKSIEWDMAFALMNLLHFYGDIHQPLHATTLYSAQFPTGDRGGNLFHVNVGERQWKLHNVWDSVCTQYQTELRRPLSSDNSRKITELASHYIDTYKISDEAKKVWNSTIMAQEGLKVAIEYAYANLTPGATISQQYIQNCEQAAGIRIVQAGYRLASELNFLFKDYQFEDRLRNLPARINALRAGFLQGRAPFGDNKH